MAEHGLLAVIVLLTVHDERQVHEIPAREGARGLADVGLAVVADPHGEQLHDLAGEVLVGGSLDVHACVQERQHCRVLSDGDHQVAEVARSLCLENFELSQQLPVIPNLALVDRVMAMPEERHLLLKRMVRPDHPVGPPVSNALGFQHALKD